MPLHLEEHSTITAKGQTTIPKSVRQALGVDYGGRVAFRVSAEGVSVHRVEPEASDPAIEAFLAFLAADMMHRPHALTPLTAALAGEIAALTNGVDVDLDAAIDGDVDLA